MPIGPFIRRLFGPFENTIAKIYRAIFMDIDAFVHQIERWVLGKAIVRIIEVGCGEGLVTERLAKTFPNVDIVGIDISQSIGRLFRSDCSRVTFKKKPIKDFVVESPSCFDLAIICDVLHHVCIGIHRDFLSDIKKILNPGGYIIIKDWVKNMTPIYLLAYLSDRYITGDRVYYYTISELRNLIKGIFGDNSIKDEVRIRPWSNNIAFLIEI